MDVYGISSPDLLRIDDLLDFSNDEIFSSSSTITSSAASSAASSSFPTENPYNFLNSSAASNSFHTSPPPLTDFTHDLCVPSDDAAHLEWLSQFVDDSFADFPANPLTIVRPEISFTGKPRSRRPRASLAGTWAPMPESELCHTVIKPKPSKKYNAESVTANGVGGGGGEARRCTHCASEKTPQWRTGPLGPKTLCNACGVRFKSGRLVPEYRPASSPTFMLTQHSNSHRKVMELRRQKEQQEQQQSAVHLPPFQPQ